MSAPLAGVRVLDLSRLLPGPYASLLLSDLGAEVTKIEDPKGGDYVRWFPPLAPDGSSYIFHALNRGKRSVALDLKSEEGKATFERMLVDVDVVLESFRPGVLEKLGLAPERLLEINPKLVICRISGYGQTGPDRLRAGHDLNYAARSGALGLMENPTPLPVQVGDLCGGSWPAALQIVAALFARRSSGKGAIIDVSMTDGVRSMMLMPLARACSDDDDEIAVGAGEDWLVGGRPCYAVYATSDGHLSVGALEPKFWHKFCDAVGLEDLKGDGLVSGAQAEAVKAKVADRLRTKPTAAWMELLRDADCCCEPVAGAVAAGRDPQLRDDVHLARVQIGEGDDAHTVDLPAPVLDLARDRPLTAGSPLGADPAEPGRSAHAREE